MIYQTKLNIKPLDFNLIELPKQTCVKHYEAITDKGHHLDMRFSGGWLTVEMIKTNEKKHAMTIMDQSIAPFGTLDLDPRQICYILGLTVNGTKIPHPPYRELRNPYGGERFFDFDKSKLYWDQDILVIDIDDIEKFIDILRKEFSKVQIIQTDYRHERLLVREIPFIMNSDGSFVLGIELKHEKLDSTYEDYIIFKEQFYLAISFRKFDKALNPKNGQAYLRKKLEQFPKKDKMIKLDWISTNSYQIDASINNDNKYAKECLEKVLKICNDYFHNNFDAYDLENNQPISLKEDYQLSWVSEPLYKWIQEQGYKRSRYSHYTVDYSKKSKFFSFNKKKYEREAIPKFIGFKPSSNKTIPIKLL